MKFSSIILVFLAAALVFACPLSGAVTPQPGVVTANPTIIGNAPTAIPPTPVAGSTTYPPLATNGPYMAYLRGTDADQQIVILDADGRGRKVFPSPLAGSGGIPVTPPPSTIVSPDGKWLAYYTGSAGTYGQPGGGTADLALNLMSLVDGSSKLVTKLLSADYPDNFAKAAAELNQQYVTAQSLQDAFIVGITQSLAWSPDGHSLAFAGQMDGTSSDVYVYDLASGTIKRLSSGAEQVQWIDWSPDGKWIVDGSTLWVGEGMSYNIYSTPLDGSTIKSLGSSKSGLDQWLDDGHTFLEYDGENGPGNHTLRSVDAQTGTVKILWQASFVDYSLDRKDGLIAITGILDPNQGSANLYLVDIAGGKQTRIKDGNWTTTPFVLGKRAFFVAGVGSSEQYFLSADGSLIPSQVSMGRPSVAPGGGHWISVSGNDLKIYASDDSLVKDVALPVQATDNIDDLLWRPDGGMVFIGFYEGSLPYSITSYSLVSVSVPDGNDVLVDQAASMLPDFNWVAGGK